MVGVALEVVLRDALESAAGAVELGRFVAYALDGVDGPFGVVVVGSLLVDEAEEGSDDGFRRPGGIFLGGLVRFDDLEIVALKGSREFPRGVRNGGLQRDDLLGHVRCDHRLARLFVVVVVALFALFAAGGEDGALHGGDVAAGRAHDEGNAVPRVELGVPEAGVRHRIVDGDEGLPSGGALVDELPRPLLRRRGPHEFHGRRLHVCRPVLARQRHPRELHAAPHARRSDLMAHAPRKAIHHHHDRRRRHR
mmetsp:Transcript_495/g.1763  ORF Transcript_495/g.1763 Transcript_495/m.1763 type:complete len:251 (+) Transcript_495:421-1173(+)